MLKIKAYRSIKLEKTRTYYTERVTMMMDEDDMTEDERMEVWEEGLQPMVNFKYYDELEERYKWISIPVQFVISIEHT